MTRCNTYNCIEEAAHTVQLPASGAGRAAEVKLCPSCHSDWLENSDFDRLRQNVDLVRARPPTEPEAEGTEVHNWLTEKRSASATELVRRADCYPALLAALKRYVDCDGYDDAVKAQGQAAIEAAS